ncbi:MAG: hypothetical protein U0586_08760 [Candidatus Brocadiaceae bacterium]
MCEDIRIYKNILEKMSDAQKPLKIKGFLEKTVKKISVKTHNPFGENPHLLR